MKGRKYYRKCGYCGKRYEQKEMIRTDIVNNGWLCKECYYDEHKYFDSISDDEDICWKADAELF